MSEVTLAIGGRKYTVACAAGEEDHVIHLGESIEAKLLQMGNGTGQETQNLLFASLLLADELHEAKSAIPLQREPDPAMAAERDEALAKAEEAISQQAALGQTIRERDFELARLKAVKEEHLSEIGKLQIQLETLRAERNGAEERINALPDPTPNAAPDAAATDTRQIIAGAPSTQDAELASALERFAELLENCADKLEGKPLSA